MSDNEHQHTAMWLAVICTQMYAVALLIEMNGTPTVFQMTDPAAKGAAVIASAAGIAGVLYVASRARELMSGE